jgi:3',5'-cyclic AMP phosphodiesterase CpdA
MRIAHVSDLHVLSPAGVHWRSVVFNKRLTGYANILLHRARVFRRDYLDAVLAAARHDADHVVVTGDLTNLSLETEYREARGMIEAIARAVEVTVVPGNHDIYLPRVQREGQFARHFAPHYVSDLPELAVDVPAGRFPCVKLRGPVAIIGLSSAVPRPPFVSAGRLGRRQLDAFAHVLAHPEVARRTPVVLVHHPPTNSRFRVEQLRRGLTDARALGDVLDQLARGLVLFGHLHVRKHRKWPTVAGELDFVCASGAALDHPSDAIRAGYNVYEIDGAGQVVAIEARVLDADGRTWRHLAVPQELP